MAAKVNHSRTQYQGRVFTLITENVTLDNGNTTNLDVIHHPGAAAMVPLTADNEVVLLRQYRHAVLGELWEIPAGTLEEGEGPEACARREVEEETGGSKLAQTAFFEPKGLWGWAYWYGSYPFHRFIFDGMVEEIAEMAEGDSSKT